MNSPSWGPALCALVLFYGMVLVGGYMISDERKDVVWDNRPDALGQPLTYIDDSYVYLILWSAFDSSLYEARWPLNVGSGALGDIETKVFTPSLGGVVRSATVAKLTVKGESTQSGVVAVSGDSYTLGWYRLWTNEDVTPSSWWYHCICSSPTAWLVLVAPLVWPRTSSYYSHSGFIYSCINTDVGMGDPIELCYTAWPDGTWGCPWSFWLGLPQPLTSLASTDIPTLMDTEVFGSSYVIVLYAGRTLYRIDGTTSSWKDYPDSTFKKPSSTVKSVAIYSTPLTVSILFGNVIIARPDPLDPVPIYSQNGGSCALDVGDVDHNGILDIVVYNGAQFFRLEPSGGTWTTFIMSPPMLPVQNIFVLAGPRLSSTSFLDVISTRWDTADAAVCLIDCDYCDDRDLCTTKYCSDCLSLTDESQCEELPCISCEANNVCMDAEEACIECPSMLSPSVCTGSGYEVLTFMGQSAMPMVLLFTLFSSAECLGSLSCVWNENSGKCKTTCELEALNDTEIFMSTIAQNPNWDQSSFVAVGVDSNYMYAIEKTTEYYIVKLNSSGVLCRTLYPASQLVLYQIAVDNYNGLLYVVGRGSGVPVSEYNMPNDVAILSNARTTDCVIAAFQSSDCSLYWSGTWGTNKETEVFYDIKVNEEKIVIAGSVPKGFPLPTRFEVNGTNDQNGVILVYGLDWVMTEAKYFGDSFTHITLLHDDMLAVGSAYSSTMFLRYISETADSPYWAYDVISDLPAHCTVISAIALFDYEYDQWGVVSANSNGSDCNPPSISFFRFYTKSIVLESEYAEASANMIINDIHPHPKLSFIYACGSTSSSNFTLPFLSLVAPPSYSSITDISLFPQVQIFGPSTGITSFTSLATYQDRLVCAGFTTINFMTTSYIEHKGCDLCPNAIIVKTKFADWDQICVPSFPTSPVSPSVQALYPYSGSGDTTEIEVAWPTFKLTWGASYFGYTTGQYLSTVLYDNILLKSTEKTQTYFSEVTTNQEIEFPVLLSPFNVSWELAASVPYVGSQSCFHSFSFLIVPYMMPSDLLDSSLTTITSNPYTLTKTSSGWVLLAEGDSTLTFTTNNCLLNLGKKWLVVSLKAYDALSNLVPSVTLFTVDSQWQRWEAKPLFFFFTWDWIQFGVPLIETSTSSHSVSTSKSSSDSSQSESNSWSVSQSISKSGSSSKSESESESSSESESESFSGSLSQSESSSSSSGTSESSAAPLQRVDKKEIFQNLRDTGSSSTSCIFEDSVWCMTGSSDFIDLQKVTKIVISLSCAGSFSLYIDNLTVQDTYNYPAMWFYVSSSSESSSMSTSSSSMSSSSTSSPNESEELSLSSVLSETSQSTSLPMSDSHSKITQYSSSDSFNIVPLVVGLVCGVLFLIGLCAGFTAYLVFHRKREEEKEVMFSSNKSLKYGFELKARNTFETGESTLVDSSYFPLTIPTSPLCLGFEASSAPVDEEITSNFSIKNDHSDSKHTWRLFPPLNPKFQLKFIPDSGSLSPGEEILVDISMVVCCTSTLSLDIPIGVCAGSTWTKSEKHTSLKISFSTETSYKLDPDEITLSQPPIGDGSYGTVFKAEYHGQEVAVKLLKNQRISPAECSAFENEIHAMESLKSPYIVKFIGACMLPGNLAIITELCEFGSLNSAIEKNPFELPLKVKCLSDAAKGMYHIHSAGMLHRDMKPDNLLVVSLNASAVVCCKISDMGTARGINRSQATQYYTKGVGTPAYMAPEILENDKYSTAADVYSFALVILSTLTESQPFATPEFTSQWRIAEFVIAGKRLPIPETVPTWLSTMISECWNANPHERPSFKEITKAFDTELKYKSTKD
ncbi:protein serine/threonine kinase [Pelomyxa schiedti]|nr:protein serine/threonine kinase [Pelomyxa schiedti]